MDYGWMDNFFDDEHERMYIRILYWRYKTYIFECTNAHCMNLPSFLASFVLLSVWNKTYIHTCNQHK